MSFPEGIQAGIIKIMAFESENVHELNQKVNQWLQTGQKGIFDIIPLSGKPGIIFVFREFRM